MNPPECSFYGVGLSSGDMLKERLRPVIANLTTSVVAETLDDFVAEMHLAIGAVVMCVQDFPNDIVSKRFPVGNDCAYVGPGISANSRSNATLFVGRRDSHVGYSQSCWVGQFLGRRH